ncbi:MAG: VOC family protein [Myxococcaceae bacterium]|nr:VOC family protein [Myxococcaceae bacterium]
MRVLGFHHLAIQCRDPDAVAAFYRDVLGLPEQARHLREDGSVRSIWLTLPDRGFLALEVCAQAPPEEGFRFERPGLYLIALRIDRGDRAAVEAELAARGVEIVHRTRWTIYVRDPEGNRVGLSHHPHDPID